MYYNLLYHLDAEKRQHMLLLVLLVFLSTGLNAMFIYLFFENVFWMISVNLTYGILLIPLFISCCANIV